LGKVSAEGRRSGTRELPCFVVEMVVESTRIAGLIKKKTSFKEQISKRDRGCPDHKRTAEGRGWQRIGVLLSTLKFTAFNKGTALRVMLHSW